MSIRRYVRQVRPTIQENHTNLVDKLQLLKESKTKQDLVEQTIAVEFNKLQKHNDPIAAARLDEKFYNSIDKQYVETGRKVAKNLYSQNPQIKVLKHFGRKGEEKTNQYKVLYPELNVKNATAKTDIGDGGKFNLSLKEAGGAQLMSPKGAESTGLVRSAIDRCNNTGVKIIGDGSRALKLLSETLDTLAVKQMYVTVGGKDIPGAKESFIEWYLVYRAKELSKDNNFKRANNKDQERHMKAELSVFKITAQDRKYRDKLIKGINPPRSMELYFKAYTEDEGVDLGDYRIPDSYFKSNKEKDLAYDNQFMKNKVVEILNIAINQTKFLKDLADEFTQNKELASYIVYEAATGLAKFTGASTINQSPPYTGSDNYVAKYMMTYDASTGAVAPLEECWSWSQNNASSLTSGLKIDFKSSRTSRAGYTKFAIGIAKKVIPLMNSYEYDEISEMFNTEYAKISPTIYEYEKELKMLNEGLLDYVRKGYSSVKDALTKIKQKIVDTLIKFLKKLFQRVVEYIKQLFNTSIKLAFDFLGVEVNTGNFQIVNNV